MRSLKIISRVLVTLPDQMTMSILEHGASSSNALHGFGKGPYVLRWGGFCVVRVASLIDAWKGDRTCLCEQNQPLFC